MNPIEKIPTAAEVGRARLKKKVLEMYKEAKRSQPELSERNVFDAIGLETGYGHSTIRKILRAEGEKV